MAHQNPSSATGTKNSSQPLALAADEQQRNRARKKAVRQAHRQFCDLESLVLQFVNHGCGRDGHELTRSEFRLRFTEESEGLKQQLQSILTQTAPDRRQQTRSPLRDAGLCAGKKCGSPDTDS